jgi:hypothetical protein
LLEDAYEQGGGDGLTSELASLTGFSGHRHDPAALIRAVNHLREFGRNQTLALLQELADSTPPGPESALLVARVLFPRSSSGAPPPELRLGAPDMGPPLDPADFPLFPVAVHREIPFVLVGGYRLGGEWDPATYLDWVRREGLILDRPLIPTLDPLEAVEELIASEAWRRLNPDPAHDAMLREQARRASRPPR